MGSGTVTDLPPGFVLDSAPSPASGLPDGFVLDSHATPGGDQDSASILAKAVEPITSYPATQSQMAREGLDLAKSGIAQIGHGTASDIAIGAGKAVLGGLGYVTSPINAALRTVVGQPIEAATGVPKEYTEFAASLALPVPKAIAAGRPARAAVQEAPTTEQLLASAQKAYAAPAVKGLEVSPDSINKFSFGLRAALSADGFSPEIAQKTFGILDRLDRAPPGATVTGDNLNSLRKMFGRAARAPDAEERKAAKIAIDALDSHIAGISPADVISGDPAAAAMSLSKARGDYASAMRSEQVTGALAKAERQAASAHSGLNVGNNIRQRFKAVLDSEKLSRGFSQDQRDLMQKIVEGSATQNAIRRASNMLGGGGGIGATAVGKLLGPVAPAIGWGLRKLGNALTESQVYQLDTAVRLDSPLGRQVNSAVRNWSVAARRYEISPTTRNAVRASVATKNLVSNLADIGIDVAPQDAAGAVSPEGTQSGDNQENP